MFSVFILKNKVVIKPVDKLLLIRYKFKLLEVLDDSTKELLDFLIELKILFLKSSTYRCRNYLNFLFLFLSTVRTQLELVVETLVHCDLPLLAVLVLEDEAVVEPVDQLLLI